MLRICKKCGQEKELELFTKTKACRLGYGHTCRKCSTANSSKWKKQNSVRIAARRRELYHQTKGKIHRENQLRRQSQTPFRFRCQLLRSGMRNRSQLNKLPYDEKTLTVDYLMERLTKDNRCECCKKTLDLGYKENNQFSQISPSIDRVDPKKGYTVDNIAIVCWRCNRIKQDATAEELRVIANFIDGWKKK